MYPLPVIYPFFIRLEMCTATEDRVMPAFSASSCWEIRGFSSIQFKICRSRWVMAAPPCKQNLIYLI